MLATRNHRSLSALALVLASSCLLAGAAAAKRSPLLLDWTAPEGCPSGAQVEAATLRLVGKSQAEPLDAVVVVQAVGTRFQARIRTAKGARERSLEGESCRAVAEAVAVTLALAIDPESNLAKATSLASLFSAAPPASESSPVHAPAVAPSTTPLPSASAVLATQPAKSTRPLLEARLTAAAESGAFPSLAVAGALWVGLRWPWISAHLRFQGWIPQDKDTQVLPTAGGTFHLWAGSGLLCLAPTRGSSLWLDLCAAAEVGSLSGSGYGVSQPQSGAQTWLGLGAGAFGFLAIAQRWSVLGGVEMMAVPLRRPFLLEGIEIVYRPSALSVRGQLGVAAHF